MMSNKVILVIVDGLKYQTVRRHMNWNNWQPDLREGLPQLVDDIKRV